MIDLHIRIPDDLAAKIRKLADDNHRSINAEILIAIEKAVK